MQESNAKSRKKVYTDAAIGLDSKRGEAPKRSSITPIARLALLAGVRRNTIQRPLEWAASVTTVGLGRTPMKVAKEIRIKEPIAELVLLAEARLSGRPSLPHAVLKNINWNQARHPNHHEIKFLA